VTGSKNNRTITMRHGAETSYFSFYATHSSGCRCGVRRDALGGSRFPWFCLIHCIWGLPWHKGCLSGSSTCPALPWRWRARVSGWVAQPGLARKWFLQCIFCMLGRRVFPGCWFP